MKRVALVIALGCASSVARADDALPPAIALDRASACVVTGASGGSSLHFVSLFLDPAGLPFATVDSNAVRVTFAAEPFREALLAIDGDGVHLEGFFPIDRLELFPKAPMFVAGILRPASAQTMRALTASGDRVGVRFVGGELTMREPPTARCADLTLDPVRFEMPKLDGHAEPAWLHTTDAIEVTATPHGPIVATFHPSSDRTAVRVLETRGDVARIAATLDIGELVAWVPSALAVTNKTHASRRGIAPRVRMGHNRVFEAPRVTCNHAVPIIARSNGVARVVGRYEKGLGPALGGPEGSLFRITTTTEIVTPSGGAEWFVRQRDVADCKPPRPISSRSR